LSKKIDADERESIDRHIQDCPYCRQDLSDAEAWRAEHPEMEPEEKKSRWGWLFPWR
jgi:Fe-S oxidoreductase